jgi:hypothetical protein
MAVLEDKMAHTCLGRNKNFNSCKNKFKCLRTLAKKRERNNTISVEMKEFEFFQRARKQNVYFTENRKYIFVLTLLPARVGLFLKSLFLNSQLLLGIRGLG